MKNKVKSVIFILSCLLILSTNVITASAAVTFTANPTTGKVPLTVTLTPNLDSTVNAYNILFGDGTHLPSDLYWGNPLFNQPVSHTYYSPGTYRPTLIMNNGQQMYVLITVTAPPAPQPGFTVNPTGGSVPLTVQITDSSTNAGSYIYNFGDGTQETTASPQHTYTQPGEYTILQVVTNAGGQATATAHVSVKAKPVAAFSIDTKSGEVPLTVHVTDMSSGATGITWKFDEISEEGVIGETKEHTFTTPGTHNIILTVSNGYDTSAASDSVTVTAPTPTADFIYTIDSKVAPATVNFDSSASINAKNYVWDFNGDGVTDSTVANPTYTFDKAGAYPVTLRVTNEYAGAQTTKSILVENRVIPDFSFTTNGDFAPVTITCDSAATQFADSVSWVVNKGETKIAESQEANPSFTLQDPGVYDVVLTASNAFSTESITKQVTVKAPVTASFTYTTDGLYVKFTDQSTGGEINSWNWDFGDGQGSTLPNPEHTFAGSGMYSVRLFVTNSDGSTSSSKTDVTVAAPAPVAQLEVSPVNGEAPLTVTFRDLSTGEINSRVWTVDGVDLSATDATLTHTFDTAGAHTVKLTVTGTSSSSDSKEVVVTSPAAVLKINGIKADVVSGAVPLKVLFTADVTGTPTLYTWTFDKLGTPESTKSSMNHVFTQPGIYDVTLTVKDAAGNTDTMTKTAFITAIAKEKKNK